MCFDRCTASAINAIAVAENKPEAQQYSLTHGFAAKARSAPDYGMVYVAMAPGKKAFPAELVPVP
jgi:hypothetical protein